MIELGQDFRAGLVQWMENSHDLLREGVVSYSGSNGTSLVGFFFVATSNVEN